MGGGTGDFLGFPDGYWKTRALVIEFDEAREGFAEGVIGQVGLSAGWTRREAFWVDFLVVGYDKGVVFAVLKHSSCEKL